MFIQHDLRLHRLRENELIAQARRHLLVRDALAGRRAARVTAYAPLLARIGIHLMELGSALQTRYGDINHASPIQEPHLKQA